MANEALVRAIRERRQALAEAIVERQYAVEGQLWEPYGPTGRAAAVRDAVYHLTYLCEALAAGEPALFDEYLAWVRVVFEGLKLPAKALLSTLPLTAEVVAEQLPPELAQPALELLTAGTKALTTPPSAPASFIVPAQPFSNLARQYLDALLAGDRRAASTLVLDSVRAGQPLRDIYLHVLQPVLREIGRLWQINRVSVAQEHFCTAATQMVMSQLYPFLFNGERKNRRLVAACVPGE